jgi:hypothetical protein
MMSRVRELNLYEIELYTLAWPPPSLDRPPGGGLIKNEAKVEITSVSHEERDGGTVTTVTFNE